ncbi:MAG: hypothetical protein HYR85_09560 [Planctomycetes bacterium]|nr:hypothetical protein [Planctomycetota bacterium]
MKSPATILAWATFTAAVASTGTASAQSDLCANATVIAPGTFMGTTAGAGTDGVSTCTGGISDVWYSFTPAQGCTMTVSLCGSQFDTVLSIHNGCPGTDLNQVACNDDFCGLQSQVTFAANGGTNYRIRIAGFDGAVGTFTLAVQCGSNPGAPANDACSSAIPVSVGTVFGTTVGASNDGTSTCGGAQSSADVWYRFDATSHCRLAAATCGASFDTALSVHSGCPGSVANEIACNDDSCALQSTVTAEVFPGNSYWIRVFGFNGNSGTFPLTISCSSITGGDLVVGDIADLRQFGRVNDVVGCAAQATLCNAGDQAIDWIANPDSRHPFVVENLYRIEGGRFEQIGQSWAKHVTVATQQDACSLGCSPAAGALGFGCSDTESADSIGTQSDLGPRSEINPWTGAFTFAGSHIATDTGAHDAIQHRLLARDADLDPTVHAGATFVAEVRAVAHDDRDHVNSVSWKPVLVSGAPGGTWTFDFAGASPRLGSAIEAWSGALLTTIPSTPVDDGRCVLAARITDNGDGTWHYSYAIANVDMDRQVEAFNLPVAADTAITNATFQAVESIAEGFSNLPWTFTRSADSVRWSTDPFATNPNANPIRWGTTYSFGFDASTGPADLIATLGLYKPGTPTSFDGATQGPSLNPCIAGAVNRAGGLAANVLFVNGSAGAPVTRKVDATIGQPITVSMSASPGGPASGRYVLWAWLGPAANAQPFNARGQSLGCTVNPSPVAPGLVPQPFACLRGGVSLRACGVVPEISGSPARAPWMIRRPRGATASATFTLQGVIEDAGAANTVGFSVTNGVVLVVR